MDPKQRIKQEAGRDRKMEIRGGRGHSKQNERQEKTREQTEKQKMIRGPLRMFGPGFGAYILGFRFPVSGLGFSCFRFHVPGSRFLVLGFRFQGQNFRLHVVGSRFQVSGSMFQVPGFWFHAGNSISN